MEKTMAERFVRYYRAWSDLTPEAHERTDGTFTNFGDYARTAADAAGVEPLTYLQWWNCKPCSEGQGIVIPNIVASFAIIQFDDGSYAMSPNSGEFGERKWIVGEPA